jgi:hypothetical protein
VLKEFSHSLRFFPLLLTYSPVLVSRYFSKAELDRYPWIKKESLVKIHTSLLKLQRQDPTQTEKTEIIVGSEVEYKDSTTGMSKLGVVCAKDEEIAHVADSSSLHRVVPWCKNAQFKGFEGSLAELVSDDKKLLEAQPTVSAEALTGDVDGEINWTKFRRSIQYLMFAHPDTHVDDSDIKTKDDASDWPKLIFLQGCRGDNSSIPVLLGVTDLKTGTLPDRQGAKKLTLQMRAPNASEMVELHEFEGTFLFLKWFLLHIHLSYTYYAHTHTHTHKTIFLSTHNTSSSINLLTNR